MIYELIKSFDFLDLHRRRNLRLNLRMHVYLHMQRHLKILTFPLPIPNQSNDASDPVRTGSKV